MFKSVFISVYGLCAVFFLLSHASAAVYTIDNTTDNSALTTCNAAAANDCSLRGAIAAANATVADDTINFSPLVFSLAGAAQIITQTGNAQFVINSVTTAGTLTIDGTRADKISIAGGDGTTNTNRVFNVAAGGNLTLNNLTVTNGHAVGSPDGGAILLDGILTVNNSAFKNNTAQNNGGAITVSGSASQLYVNNSTFSDNAATTFSSGAVNFYGGLGRFTNSTFTRNSASTAGGVSYISGTTNVIFTNCTITENNAATSSTGGAIAIASNSGVKLRNNVIARNNFTTATLNKDIYINGNGIVTTLGNNLIGNNSGATTEFPAGVQINGDRSGTTAAPLDPRLSPFGFHGGGLQTFVPTNNTVPANISPAINTGANCVFNLTCATDNPAFALTADERGAARFGTIADAVDIGAVENSVAAAAVLPVAKSGTFYSYTIVPDTGNFNYTMNGTLPAGLSLSQAFTAAPAKGDDNNDSPQAALVISGTPTAPSLPVQISLSGADANTGGVYTQIYQIIVNSPTAASVQVSGRVTNSFNKPVRGAVVTINGINGDSRTAVTNVFGYYNFTEVPSGETYIFNVRAKRCEFNSQALFISTERNDVDFTATP